MKNGILLLLFSVRLSAVMIIGHRGCGYAPENTLSSFSKAIELGVDMVELDVWQCASGELVVLHDKKVDRMTNGTGYVTEKSLAELKLLDVKGGERIPTLKQVFDLVARRVKIYVELKGPGTARPVAVLIKEYVHQKGWSYDDFVVASFNHYALQDFKRACPYVKTGAIVAGIFISLGLFAYQASTDIAVLSSDFIHKALVDDLHARGIQVFVYTVNDPQEAYWMRLLGVDGLISDYPDRVMSY